MKDLIRRILKEQSENPLNKREILLFKYLNDNRKGIKDKKDLIELIKNSLGYFGFPISDATMYYEIYTANFRPEGDYQNITKETFKDYKQYQKQKTGNKSAYEYASGKIPFIGSNVEGEWGVNKNNEWYYVVKSYGWYPIFLFINNQWYRTLDTYSSTTRKHISQSDPGRYNSELDANVIAVSRVEIEKLMDGNSTLNDV